MRLLPLILLLGCAAAPAAPDALPYADPDEPGPYGVGARTLIWEDERGTLMTAELWYPAEVEPGSAGDDYGPVSRAGIAHREATPDLRGAPWPVASFSHGFGGIRYQSTFLTEHLASHGFVVVAPDHPTNTLFDLVEENVGPVAAARPADVRLAVDRVYELSDEDWFGLGGAVDPEAGYGVVGHSFGAWTSMAVAGGRVDPDHALSWCSEHDESGCRFFDDLAGLSDLAGAAPDPRARAAVALAPGGWYTYATEGLADVRSPLVIGGDRDGDMPYDSEIRPLWERLGADDKALLTLAGAAHWGFTDLCTTLSLPNMDDCGGEDEGYLAPEITAARTNAATTAWLLSALRADERMQPWLGADAWASDPDATWE
jgi:predicted dienelactone hydrolase